MEGVNSLAYYKNVYFMAVKSFKTMCPEVDVGQIEGAFVFGLGLWLQVPMIKTFFLCL
jgi:hypothetical protein